MLTITVVDGPEVMTNLVGNHLPGLADDGGYGHRHAGGLHPGRVGEGILGVAAAGRVRVAYFAIHPAVCSQVPQNIVGIVAGGGPDGEIIQPLLQVVAGLAGAAPRHPLGGPGQTGLTWHKDVEDAQP